MKNRMIVGFFAVATVAAGSWALAQGGPGNPKHGQTVYEQLCLRCHGATLDGLGPDARDLKKPPANLKSLSTQTKNDWELLIVIAHGVMFTPMHGFRDVLDEKEIRDVLSYIRLIAPYKPVA